ncbi:endonuclease domain-containing protein [Prauserella oleivorans]
MLRLATGKSESPQESRLRLLVVDAGFPLPTPQYEITTLDGRLLYVLDLAWPEVRVGLEYDGYEAHEDRATYDAERDRRMADRGWITVRVRKDAFADPAVILEQLREAFRRRGRDVELRQPPTRLRDRRTRRPGQQTR